MYDPEYLAALGYGWWYEDPDVLQHYGTPRHSGRYPWGSGENPYQRYANFKGNVDALRAKGMSNTEIARSMGMTTSIFRAKLSMADDELRKERVAEATKLRKKGYSLPTIAKRMGLPNESSVRSLLNQKSSARMEQTKNLMDTLKKAVEEDKYVDVGAGCEKYLGISAQKLKNACILLEDEGYKVTPIYQQQSGMNRQRTPVKVLTKKDTPYGEISGNKDKIMIPGYRPDPETGTLEKLEPPRPLDAKRIMVRYAEEGGKQKDGIIELRRGVDDISLKNALYAQVRIATKEDSESDKPTHYLKGVALYSNDDAFPPGIDVIFNSNKPKGTDLFGKTTDTSVFKPIKKDAEETNPFGATIKSDMELIRAQRHYIDKDGNKQLSCLNIVNEEGNWGEWTKSLSSQFLSKQQPSLIKRQTEEAYSIRRDELNEILSLTNPVVRKQLLDSFAEDCDAAAVHLKGASMPRQRSQLILPFPNLKENECYAPRFKDGETVVLVRYPHAGLFEISELKVNNRFKEAKDILKRPDGSDAIDAIGIHPKAAEKLSGADFDGDTVIVIPNNDKQIKVLPALEGLKDFSTDEYKLPEDAPPVDIKHGFHKGKQMGSVSNLITDMTIKGAKPDELARAVRHSMVIIDAEKHHLDWKQSELENGILALKAKYQGGPHRGASTLISKASAEYDVEDRRIITNPKRMTPEQRERYYNGEVIYEPTGATRIDKKGKEVKKLIKSTWMFETHDARQLSSGSVQENLYAEFANKLKRMAEEARKASIFTEKYEYSPSAKQLYKDEVQSLKDKLFIAERNRPLERKAQMLCGKWIQAARQANPDMDADDIKKLKGRKIIEARNAVGAKKQRIDITPEEWAAIQARAISSTTLKKILNNADMDIVREYSMPKTERIMSKAKISRAKSMIAQGRELADIAEALGVSVSTIERALD